MDRRMIKIKKRKRIALILIIAFFSALLIESIGFNFKNIINASYSDKVSDIEYVNFEKDADGNLIATQSNAEIKLNFEKKFVKNIKYNINLLTGNQDASKYKLMVNGKDFFNKSSNVFNRFFGMENKTVSINHKTNEAVFYFSNMQDTVLHISDINIANYFQFNFIRFFAIFVINILILMILLFRKLGIKLETFSVTAILLIGLLMSILVPPHHTWDEYSHLTKAYSVAQGKLFATNESIIDYPEDLNKLDRKSRLEFQSYDDYKKVKKAFSNTPLKNTESKAQPTSAIINLFTNYVFSALGMKIAMIFQMPVLYYLILGRFMNVIAYAFFCYFAIKKMPIKKNLLAFYAMLPINVFLAASLSCDFLAIGGLLLALAYTLDIIVNKKKVRIKDIVVLLLLYSLITFAKVSYAPMFVFMFLLGKKQFSTKKIQILYGITVVISCAVIAIGTYYYASRLGIVQWDIPGVDSALQVNGILKSPLSYLKMLIVFLSERTMGYCNLFGSFAYLGSAPEITTSVTLICLLFLSWFDLPNYPYKEFDGSIKLEKSIILLGSLGALGLSLTALYISFTPVGATVVNGFQGRYLLPIIFPVLLLLRNKKTVTPFDEEYLKKMACIISIVVTIPVIYMLINNFYGS